MAEEISGVDPNRTNPNNPGKNQAPVDPSNTSDIGQKVEQGVVDIKEGISEQSGEWEDAQERGIPVNSTKNRVESYLKDPSPEENNTESDQ
ncbi:MAG: hypothetical protein M3040_17625 [Bacteroidota bacterium]|nr:hypothetical protein [Bacteroidota bacterium]